MAGVEQDKRNSGEKAGVTVRNIGLVLVAIGLLAEASLVLPGAGLAASGVIFERVSKSNKK